MIKKKNQKNKNTQSTHYYVNQSRTGTDNHLNEKKTGTYKDV